MLLASYDIVFSEVPGEVTLALNLSQCPCHCEGCHSTHLWTDTGETLDEELLGGLLKQYAGSVTCVCFMGGDRNPAEVADMARWVKSRGTASGSGMALKTAWYSGREAMPPLDAFDYVKLGAYTPSRGGLDTPGTNQRMLKIVGDATEDITHLMRKTAHI